MKSLTLLSSVAADGAGNPVELPGSMNANIFVKTIVEPALPEISTIAGFATDVAGDTNAKTITLTDGAGTVGVYVHVTGEADTPPEGVDRVIKVSYAAGATAAVIGAAWAAAIEADAALLASFASSTVTVTDAATGTRTNINAGSSGLTVATTQQGRAVGTTAGGTVFIETLSPDGNWHAIGSQAVSTVASQTPVAVVGPLGSIRARIGSWSTGIFSVSGFAN